MAYIGLILMIFGMFSFIINIQVIYFWIMNNDREKFDRYTMKTLNMKTEFWKYLFSRDDEEIDFIRKSKKSLKFFRIISPICLVLGIIILKIY